MRKILLPGPRLNLSSYGPLLLAAGLLLVFVQGLLQLYTVQNFFFPGQYQTNKLKLINKELVKIGRGLTSLQNQITILTGLQPAPPQPDPVTPSRALAASPLPPPAAEVRCSPDSAWQEALHTAKKKRVYAARKLNHLRLILQSMRLDLEARLARLGSDSAAGTLEMELILQQIRETRELWRTCDDKLQDLSLKLDKMAACPSPKRAGGMSEKEKE
jgi:hypothetical protein